MAGGLANAMHHTIIAVDVEGFGARDGPHQTKVREGLSAAVHRAFHHCGLPWSGCRTEDRGDGMLVLVPAHVSSARLVECLPTELAARLREHNATADEQAKIRLKIVIHSGEVLRDRQGYSSPAVVHACRLLDSAVLRGELRNASGVLALITSDDFFTNVVSQNPAVDHRIYRKVAVAEKETRTVAWVCLPDDHEVPRRPRPHPGRHRRERVPLRGRLPRLPVTALTLTLLLLVGGTTGNVFAALPPSGRCAVPVQLNVNVSMEKSRVLRDLAEQFERSTQDDRGCKGVSVQVTVARAPESVIEAIGRGWSGREDVHKVGPEPHVLLPDSGFEFDAAVRALQLSGHDEMVLEDWGPIALSPLVLARPRPPGDLPDPPVQPATWSSVLETAEDNASSSDRRYHRPSPITSGAGLTATIVLYRTALERRLDAEALSARGAPNTLHQVELSVVAGDESGDLLCSTWEHPGASGTVLVSEKAAADYNEGDAPPGAPCAPRTSGSLDITYPRIGTPYLDHPFVAVSWRELPTNPARDRAVRSFHEYLVGPDGQAALRRARFRDRLGDTVDYEGAPQDRPARLGLEKVDVPAVVQAFHDARRAVRVQLLVDVSTAMSVRLPELGGSRLEAAADAVFRTLRSVGDRDRVGLWEFAQGHGGRADHQVLLSIGDGTAQRARESLSRVSVSGRPARLYPTLEAAVLALRSGRPASPEVGDAILVVADGSRNEVGHSQLVEVLAAGEPVPVFLIAFAASVCDSRQWREITQETGGACHEVRNMADIDTALESVATVLWGGRR
ncbi:vWA domain-containing protein [Actinophytocola xanthii]|uniref:vWA domain-containing protein n=1 Tax=Actinophytocola xanthii TaxID=1912961 RepID=UPI001177D4AE|nr:substrate-binding domain-containing protein [Actinophytocola xanthii]